MRRAVCVVAFIVVAVLLGSAVADADPLTLGGFMTFQGSFLTDFAFSSDRFDLHHFAPQEFWFSVGSQVIPCSTQPCTPGMIPARFTWNGGVGASGVIDGQPFVTIFDEDLSDDPIEGVSLFTTLHFAFDDTVALPPASSGGLILTAAFTVSGQMAARPGPGFGSVVFASDVAGHGTARMHFTLDNSLPGRWLADSATLTFDGTAATPEPATWILILSGLALLGFVRGHP